MAGKSVIYQFPKGDEGAPRSRPSSGTRIFREISLGAQGQIAIFFVSDGETIIRPKPVRFFEVPIQGPLPEELNYIP